MDCCSPLKLSDVAIVGEVELEKEEEELVLDKQSVGYRPWVFF